MINVAYKFRIYPNPDQEVLISRTFGCVRFVYNHLLADSEENYNKTKKHEIKTPAQYKEEFPWLKEVDSLSLCNAQVNLQTAYSNFFRNVKTRTRKPSKKNPYGFPQFKSKKNNRLSYTTNNIGGTIRIQDGKLRLPKLGLVETVFHRKVNGKIKSVAVSHNPSGKYFASILTEQEVLIPAFEYKKETKILGIDMSLPNLAVLSSGEKTNPPRWFYETEKRISRANRRLSRKQVGSFNRDRARIDLAKLYERMDFQRKDFLHKLSVKLLSEYDVIALEDINLSAMSRCLNFGKSVHSNAFGEFRTFLEYKAERLGKLVWYADKFFASSQLCSVCGYKNPSVKDLSVREWRCPNCGTVHNRDHNASVNLEKECRSTLASKGIYACGDTTSVRKPSVTRKPFRRSKKSCSTCYCKPSPSGDGS